MFLTNICKQIFWLEIKFQCKINLTWVPSKENKADPSTRVEEQQDLSLSNTSFQTLLHKKGPFHMDLMSSYATVYKDTVGNHLPLYSQYYEAQATSTDVFAQNLTRLLTPEDILRGPDYCFPPFKMIGQFLSHLLLCKGWCIVIVPDIATRILETHPSLRTNRQIPNITTIPRQHLLRLQTKYFVTF